jgi:hypothetical protein
MAEGIAELCCQEPLAAIEGDTQCLDYNKPSPSMTSESHMIHPFVIAPRLFGRVLEPSEAAS